MKLKIFNYDDAKSAIFIEDKHCFIGQQGHNGDDDICEAHDTDDEELKKIFYYNYIQGSWSDRNREYDDIISDKIEIKEYDLDDIGF